MIYVPILLFSFTALLGFLLLFYVLKGKFTPKAITIVHGFCGVLGLGSLIGLAIYSSYKLWLCVILFFIAAIGGFYLLFKDITDKVPKSISIIHGLVAVLGLIVLIFAFLH